MNYRKNATLIQEIYWFA